MNPLLNPLLIGIAYMVLKMGLVLGAVTAVGSALIIYVYFRGKRL